MPIKIEYKSEQEVRDIPMTGLVSYSDVIDETYRLLKLQNLGVNRTIYKPNANGDTVTAIIVLNKQTGLLDTDLEPCIAWTHSYHKAIRFQCNASAITADGMLVVRDPTPVSKTRRSSEATKYQAEIFDDLKLEINFMTSSFTHLIEFKNNLQKTKANIGAASVSLGLLYVEEDVLTTSQAAVIKEQIKTLEIENGWDMYSCFGEGLKDSHPKLFLIDHIKMFSFFEEVFTDDTAKSEPEKLSLSNKFVGKTVNEEIKEEYNFVSPMPSVTFL